MSAKKQHNSEAIIRKLRQAEVLIHEGQSISEICRTLGISDATYYKWRKEIWSDANGPRQTSKRA